MSISVSEIFFELTGRPLGFDVENDPEGDHVLVSEFTVENSTAEHKGLRIGDRIEKLNGTTRNCLTRAAFTKAIRDLPEETPVKIAVSRPSHVDVKRGALSEHTFTFTQPGSLGMMLTDGAVTIVENDGTQVGRVVTVRLPCLMRLVHAAIWRLVLRYGRYSL